MKETVDTIMTKKFFKIEVSRPLQEAKEMFEKHNIRHLPVVAGEKLVGMLSWTDIVRLSFGDTYVTNGDENDMILFDLLTIQDVMMHHPRVVSPNESIEDVTSILIKEKFHALPVSDNKNLVGIVTTTDIIRYQQAKLTSPLIPEKYSEDRPWGNFEQFCKNSPCTVKLINVKPYEELSLQYHLHRNEFWKVIQGDGIIVIGNKEKIAIEGDEFFIAAKSNHQIKTNRNSIQILEISFGVFDENDIVRLKDKYQRETLTEDNTVLV